MLSIIVEAVGCDTVWFEFIVRRRVLYLGRRGRRVFGYGFFFGWWLLLDLVEIKSILCSGWRDSFFFVTWLVLYLLEDAIALVCIDQCDFVIVFRLLYSVIGVLFVLDDGSGGKFFVAFGFFRGMHQYSNLLRSEYRGDSFWIGFVYVDSLVWF